MDTRTDKEFDDLLRKRYEDHTIEPGRALWEGINTHLYQKKTDRNIRKVRQLKIAISAVAAILAGVIVYSVIRTEENKPETQIISEIPVTSAPADNEDLLKSGLNNKINNERSKYSDKPEQEKFYPELKEKKPGLIKKSLASSVQFMSPVTDSSYKKTLLLTSSEFHDTLSIKNRYIQPVNGIILSDYLQARSVKIVEHAPSVLPGQIRSDIDKSDDTKETALNSIRSVSEKTNQPEPVLPGGLTILENSQKHPHFFIEANVSPEMSYRALSVNNKYSVPDYGKSYFNKAESPDFTFSAGISAGLRITDKFIIKSGVYYSRYSYKFRTDAFNLIDNGAAGNLIYTSSGPVYIALFSSDSISAESLIKSSISFSFINIPLLAELHLGNNYFINLGLNLNILAGQNMNWQAEDYDGHFSQTASDPIDGLEFGSLSLTAGIGKEKYITQQLSILINPSFRVNLTSLNNIAPVKSYPYSWGLNAGLRYYFD